jgi:hypothetical protein
MTRRSFILLGLFTGCVVSTGIFAPSPAWTQSDQVKASMAALMAKTKALGAPKIEGVDPIGGKEAPALYFGSAKINNSFDLVDALAREQGGVATLFAKSGDDFIRVSTNVKKDDGSRDWNSPQSERPRDCGHPEGRILLRRREHSGEAVRHRLRADPRRGKQRHRNIFRRVPEVAAGRPLSSGLIDSLEPAVSLSVHDFELARGVVEKEECMSTLGTRTVLSGMTFVAFTMANGSTLAQHKHHTPEELMELLKTTAIR